jgi:hypothetical protein
MLYPLYGVYFVQILRNDVQVILETAFKSAGIGTGRAKARRALDNRKSQGSKNLG